MEGEKRRTLHNEEPECKWEADAFVIQVGSHVSQMLEPSAAFFFGIVVILLTICLATDQKHKTPYNIRSIFT